MEGINKAKENFKEDSTTKAKASTTMEENSKEEDSKTKVQGLEEAETTSTQMISTFNNHLVLPVTVAPLQPTKPDSSLIGTVVMRQTHTKIRIRIPINVTQTKDGSDN